MTKNFPKGWRNFRTPKGHKYRAQKLEIDNIKFPSRREGKRYAELKLLLKAGEIADLKVHQRFSIDINDQHVCDYIADFVYDKKTRREDPQHGHGITVWELVVEDAKGFRTPEFKLKKKLMKAVRGIEVQEV